MCLHSAPVDDRIVVSEIGEQWSPYTDPANVAPSAGIRYTSAPGAVQIIVMIGISMPNVPQDVPIEKLMSAEMMKIRTGRNAKGRFAVLTKPEIKRPVPMS